VRLVRELRFGEIYVNRPGGDAVHAYHAGLRHSGVGGEDGKYGLDGAFATPHDLRFAFRGLIAEHPQKATS